jgi:predicted aldo/keto reductase-like oxidoreductase
VISGRRERLILATKSLARTREEIESHLKLSLERLGVESIDLYQFHNVSDADTLETILDPNGPMAVVQEAKRAGRVKHIGITSHQIDTAKKAVKSDCFETIMFPFNFITHEAADELLPLAREHDVGFIAMKPLAGGMLDNVTLAIKYLLQFPDVVLIPGIEKVHEIEEIMQILEGPKTMTAAQQEEIEQLRQELGTRFCRRCDYCQPCQVEIPISDVMAFRSAAKRLPPVRLFTGKFAEALEKAANCTECGECEERCPYHLPIRETIAENFKLYQAGKKEYQEQLASR